MYFKLFMSALGILSIQFLLSLLFRDFLKPMGIGFLATIAGVIAVNVGWHYAYLFPYSHALMILKEMPKHNDVAAGGLSIDLFTKEIFVSMIVAVAVFAGGYFIVLKKSVK
jgi:lantibiotic transport system permease protein